MKSDQTGMSRNPAGAVSRGRFFSGLGLIRDVPWSVIVIASFFSIFLLGCGEKTEKGAAARLAESLHGGLEQANH